MAYEDDVEILDHYAVKSSDFNTEKDDEDDSNEAYRHENEQRVTEAEVVSTIDGYLRDLERSFNPVTDKDQAEEYVEHEHEFAIDPYGNEHYKEPKHKKRNRFFGLLKISNINAMRPLKIVLQNVLLSQLVAEKVSTYRFHSIRDPKNQAGVFDNKKVTERRIMLEEKNNDAHHAEDVMRARDTKHKVHERF